MMAFLSLLVAKGWFLSIEHHFLAPGHSHDMVDRDIFGPLGTNHRFKEDCWTFADIPQWISTAFKRYKTKPEIESSSFPVFDFKKFFEGHLLTISNHSEPRSFRFVMEDGNPVFYVKMTVLSSTWYGFQNSQDVGYRILRKIPKGIPQVISPKNIPDDQLSDIAGLSSVPPTSKDWWTRFRQKQIAPAFGKAPDGLLEDFWLAAKARAAPAEDDSQEEEDEPAPRVRVANHPRVFNCSQLKVGDRIAFLKDPNYVPQTGYCLLEFFPRLTICQNKRLWKDFGLLTSSRYIRKKETFQFRTMP